MWRGCWIVKVVASAACSIDSARGGYGLTSSAINFTFAESPAGDNHAPPVPPSRGAWFPSIERLFALELCRWNCANSALDFDLDRATRRRMTSAARPHLLLRLRRLRRTSFPEVAQERYPWLRQSPVKNIVDVIGHLCGSRAPARGVRLPVRADNKPCAAV